ncbi:acyl-CoA dehydrogenase family protein [Streptomyces noursei]|uniref:acyl-CoA dehydrogenase family protein n=1 Tax=Streptomyces noursei TaxID=1971 RepID=UPI001964598B|nr:acyl-CoA dehydrogenase family protein [Streptomyces noursei]QRX96117.1 acyl-CoA dehydrogenase family protein [Streptomyces noursei]
MTDAADLRRRTAELLATHPPTRRPAPPLAEGPAGPHLWSDTDRLDFLRARFDAGLAWVHFPEGLGGLDAPRSLQAVVDAELAAAGAPDNDPGRIGIGLGMAAPTILRYGTEEQKQRFLRPLWTGEEVWCQLFSEPGAGSDLAALATRAVRDDNGNWVVDGQKVWTSSAHLARWAILVARTDPAVPKHQGLTYFVCDMTDPGVEVRPLRQITGEAEFNEVFLSGVRIPDAQRLGAVGDGWQVARTTLMNERVAIGGARSAREGGMIGVAAAAWRDRPELRTHDLHRRLLTLWVEAEVARLTGERLRQQLSRTLNSVRAGGTPTGQPGPEGSGMKLAFARLAQQISGWEVEFLGEDGLTYDDWTLRRPEGVDFTGREAGYRYLRAKGNSIEGGTSEVLLNIVAERVLGLPPEPRTDKDVAWKDLPR